jgi:hypothetical protein
MRPLIKHVITIWSETPLENAEINRLAQEAVDGDAYCSNHTATRVEDPKQDPDWDGTEFFGDDDEDDEEDS